MKGRWGVVVDDERKEERACIMHVIWSTVRR
jgi:hypothetical protein